MKELNTFRKFLNEGTWSLGTPSQMVKALEEMNAMMMHSDPRQFKAGLEAMDNALYRIFGDDQFHDEFSNAKSLAAEGDLDRAKNALGDAMSRAKALYEDELKFDLEENSRMEFEITPEYLFNAALQYIQDDYDGASLHVAPDGSTDDFYDGDKHVHTIKSKEQAEDIINNFEAQSVKENDKTLDEIIDEEKEEVKEATVFDNIDMMLDKAAVHMSADEVLQNLVSEFQIISGGTQILNMALKNIMADAGLMEEEKGEE